MKELFKPHIDKMSRYQTSLGRDLDHGIRLDRNEKVSNFSDEVMQEIFGLFKNYSLSASPEAAPLYDAIAKSLGINKEKVFLSSGITEGIRVLYDFTTEPGDNVIGLDPTYPLYWIYADMYDVNYRKFTYDKQSLKPDLNTLYDQMDEKTRFVFLPNPNLPIESCFELDELRDIAKKCRENNTFFVIDEAYHFFGAPSAMPLVDEFDNVIVFRTFSKAYGLAGLRVGFMVSQEQNIEYFSKSRSIVESNNFSMAIAQYMLEHPELRDGHVSEVKQGAEFLKSELDTLGLKYYGGTYTNGILIFLDSKEQSDKAVQHFKDKKIYIRGAFEDPFQSTVRVSLGPVSQMEVFVSELKNFLQQ